MGVLAGLSCLALRTRVGIGVREGVAVAVVMTSAASVAIAAIVSVGVAVMGCGAALGWVTTEGSRDPRRIGKLQPVTVMSTNTMRQYFIRASVLI
jgi:hypothetical protein